MTPTQYRFLKSIFPQYSQYFTELDSFTRWDDLAFVFRKTKLYIAITSNMVPIAGVLFGNSRVVRRPGPKSHHGKYNYKIKTSRSDPNTMIQTLIALMKFKHNIK